MAEDDRTSPHAVAAAITDAARTLHRGRSLEETLDVIVSAALRSVPGFDHVGVSIVHKDGRVETKAATDQFVWENDSLQYELGEGPCVSTLRGEPVVVVEHARHEQRWPSYIPRAVQAGLQAQLALRLYVDDETLGGLNLYSTGSDTIAPDAVSLAELFAAHAAIALGRARDLDHLNTALSTRKLIGQAIGLLMERYKVDSEAAFQFLVRASSTSNIKLRDIAAEMVEQADQAARGGGST
jgi:GAF domain-containing protein